MWETLGGVWEPPEPPSPKTLKILTRYGGGVGSWGLPNTPVYGSVAAARASCLSPCPRVHVYVSLAQLRLSVVTVVLVSFVPHTTTNQIKAHAVEVHTLVGYPLLEPKD